MAVISIGGFDLYPYTRILAGEGMDVADTDFIEPNFGDTSSSFGDPLLSIKRNNREIVVPIHLRSANKTKAGLHTILIQLNQALRNGKTLTWQDDGATNPSYLTVQFARFEPDFNKRRQDAGWMSGLVRVFTGPYARSVSSGYATVLTASVGNNAVMGSVALPSMSLSDGPLAYRIQINAPSQLSAFSEGRIVGAAVLPPSYVADWAAASLLRIGANASLMTVAAAASLQVVGKKTWDLLGAGDLFSYLTEPFAQLIITNASAYAGNNRVLAVTRSRLPAVGISIVDDNGFPKNYNSLPTAYGPLGGFNVIDLGVVNIDPRQGATKVLKFQPVMGVPGVNAQLETDSTPDDIQINRIIILPEDTTQYVVDDNGRRAIGAYVPRYSTSSVSLSVDDFGNTFSTGVIPGVASHQLNVFSGNVGVPTAGGGSLPIPAANIANIPTSYNLSAQMAGYIQTIHSPGVSPTIVHSIGKYFGVGSYVIAARLQIAVSTLGANHATTTFQILYGGLGVGLGAPSVIACSAVYTGSANYQSPWYRLRFRQQGPVINAAVAYEGTQGVFNLATLSASIGAAAFPGIGIIGLNDASNESYISWWTFSEVPSTGISGGDAYILDGETQTAYRGNTQNYNLARSLRGNFIEHDPDPDITRRGALVPFVLPLDNESTSLNWSYQVSYNEHFTYAVI